MTSKNRFIEIDNIVNLRDLGGYQTASGRRVKWRQLYRSGQFDRLRVNDFGHTQKLAIQTVVDLRFGEESHRYPTDELAFPEATFLSWDAYQDSTGKALKFSWHDAIETGDPMAVREAMRINYPSKLYSHKSIFKLMIESILEGRQPLLFHCAAGKDRTGVAAALLLSLLGVPRSIVVEDYLLTEQEMPRLRERFRAGGAANNDYNDLQQRLMAAPPEVIAPIFDADRGYIDTLFEHVEDKFGTFTDYAAEMLDFRRIDIEQLQARLLEPA